MHLKKTASLFILLTGLLAANLGLAHTMPQAELALGKVQLGSTLQQVSTAWGQPTKMTNEVFSEGIQLARYYYGNDLEVIGRGFLPEVPVGELKVTGFRCQSKDYTTPSGIAVGTAYSKVVEKFGAGEKLNREYVVNPVPGCTYYIYDVAQTGRQMLLAVNEEDIIQFLEINIEL